MVCYKRIVVGTDFSPRSDVALSAALQLARRQAERRVTLVHVLDTTFGGSAIPYDAFGEERAAKEQEAVDWARERLREVAQDIADVEIDVMVRRGNPAKELARGALSLQADLVVTSTQGRGAIKRAVLGSTTTSLLGVATCPVLVVGEDRGGVERAARLTAAVDLSPVSLSILEHASGLVEGGGHVDIVSVFDGAFDIPVDHPAALDPHIEFPRVEKVDELRNAVETLAQAAAWGASVTYAVRVVPGSPPHLEVLEQARRLDADIIVVGASGHRTWSKALFGSNAARIIAACHVPVLVVPDPSLKDPELRTPTLKTRSLGKRAKEQIVYATFVPDAVEGVITRLTDANIESAHLSVVMSKETHAKGFAEEDQTDEGFLAGGAVGTAVGGVLGGLASLGASTGVGLVVLGPAIALGLIGGLIGTLVGYGVPEHDAALLQDAVERGKVVVAVHAYDLDEVRRAKTAFADAGAQPQRLCL